MAGPRPNPDPDAPYETLTPDWWLEEVSTWQWQQLEDEKWKLSGNCPRCGHLMSRVEGPGIVVFSTGVGVGSRHGVPDVVFVECNCTDPHKDRPDGETGCGPSGQIPGPLNPGGAFGVVDPLDRQWEHKRAELLAQALPNIRSAAEKWGATIAALTGILGISSFLGGRDELAKLSENTRLAVGVALALAALLAVIATYLAALAAQGTPETFVGTTDGFRQRYENAVKEAAKKLKTSRGLTVLALLPLAAAVGLMLFGPSKQDDDEGQAVVVVSRDGAPVCGTLATGTDGELSLEQGGQPATLEHVTSIVAVDACP